VHSKQGPAVLAVGGLRYAWFSTALRDPSATRPPHQEPHIPRAQKDETVAHEVPSLNHAKRVRGGSKGVLHG